MLRTALFASLLASPLAAQEYYGSSTLSLGQSETKGAPVSLQGADGSLGIGRIDLSFGRLATNGTYLQADLGLSASDNAETAPNTANTASSLILRIGRDAGRFGYGAFAGALMSDHDTDASDDATRLLAGIEGRYALSDRWAFGGHLGYLTGDSGSDSVATVTDGVFTGLSASFAASERLSLASSIGYLNAKMDAPSTVVELWTLEVRADYDITAIPGMSLFAAAQYGESHQKEIIGPDDITDTTTLMVGITYRFGAKRPNTTDLGYLTPYLANTGGILE